jgi:hypothetical protein
LPNPAPAFDRISRCGGELARLVRFEPLIGAGL